MASVFVEFNGTHFDETYSLHLEGRITREEWMRSIQNINSVATSARSSQYKRIGVCCGKDYNNIGLMEQASRLWGLYFF